VYKPIRPIGRHAVAAGVDDPKHIVDISHAVSSHFGELCVRYGDDRTRGVARGRTDLKETGRRGALDCIAGELTFSQQPAHRLLGRQLFAF
jgi:hypothetical protein